MIAKLRDFLATLSEDPIALQCIRTLRLNKLMKKLSFWLLSPPNRIKNVVIGKYSANFFINSYEKLQYLNHIFDNYFDEGKFIRMLQDSISEGDIVFDVGAHMGLYSIFMSKIAGPKGKVIAFEPDEANFKLLQKNIALNQIMNIQTFMVALGDTLAEGNIHINKHIGSLSSSLVPENSRHIRQAVKIIPGDIIIQKENISIPNIIKIDTEGYEYPVLIGLQKTLSQNKCRTLFCEIHNILYPKGLTLEQIINLILIMGFTKIKKIYRQTEIQLICRKP